MSYSPSRGLDGKIDLGYGRNSNNPHLDTAVENESFPYSDPHEDFEYSEEEINLVNKILRKTEPPFPDSDAISAYDQSAYHDIIMTTETARGMVPFPTLYKNRSGHLGAKVSPKIDRTTLRGSRIKTIDYNLPEEHSEENIYNLEDLAIKQLRECIRNFILEFMYE